MFGLEYSKVNTEDELKNQLDSFFNIGKKPKLMEIFTPKSVNDHILKNYFNFLSPY
jgi:2-succinyl-5-enolpyruvyl-6-hydroxy-3-cyclohexene-1-carboxylate synthase